MSSDALVTLAADLIRADSPSGRESRATDVLLRAMRSRGFDDTYLDEAGNAVGVLRFGEGPTIMMNGHLDTVPLGDPELWPHPALSGAVADGRLWGRGSSDMKTSLACMVLAAADLAASAERSELRGTLLVTGVVQEEVGGLGARHMGRTLPADVIVLGEPSNCNLMLGHRGRMEVEVRFPGKIAHAAKAQLGENALYHAARYLARLERLELPSGGPLVGSSATPTQLVSFPEDGANVVPGGARLTVDYRTIPGDDGDAVLERLRGLAEDPRVEVTIPEEHAESESGEVVMDFPRVVAPYLAPGEHPHVETARRAVRAALDGSGIPFLERTWWFATDAPHLVQGGGVVVGLGPGEEELAHTTQESVKVENLHIARAAYRALARAYLGGGR